MDSVKETQLRFSTDAPFTTSVMEAYENRREGFSVRVRGAWRNATQGTVLSSIFILLTTCIGAGTLSLPYAFSKGGIFVFSAIFFLIMVMLCAITLDYKFIELYLIICYDSTQDAIHNETSLYWDLGNCLLYRGCP